MVNPIIIIKNEILVSVSEIPLSLNYTTNIAKSLTPLFVRSRAFKRVVPTARLTGIMFATKGTISPIKRPSDRA